MDLTDLWNGLKEAMNPGSSAIYTAPGQSYGPAVSRTTRVPIQFRSGLPGGGAGLYIPPANSSVNQPIPSGAVIKVDPTSADFQTTYKGNVTPVVQHEAAHAILEPKNTDYEALANQNKAYSQVADKLGDSRLGFQPAEIPAYMSESGAASRWGLPQNLVDLYRNQMSQGLPAATAAAYTRNLGK